MPLLNYTTKISADRTVSEVMQILARAGATGVTVQYDPGTVGRPYGVIFGLLIQDREIAFKLPINIPGVQTIMENDKDVPKRLKNLSQAERVAWRIVKDWIKAQTAYIEAGQATMAELFFPHAINNNGQTFFEQFENYVALPEGDKHG